MRVADLKGGALDYWVAKASGFGDKIRFTDYGPGYEERCFFFYPLLDEAGFEIYPSGSDWNPSSNWDQGGPIIHREGIGFWKGYDSESRGKVEVWEASTLNPVSAIEVQGPQGIGPTPLIAAMCAYVRLKFGREVEDAPHEAG